MKDLQENKRIFFPKVSAQHAAISLKGILDVLSGSKCPCVTLSEPRTVVMKIAFCATGFSFPSEIVATESVQ